MDLSFAYANTRVKGMKSNLLSRETVRKLLDVGTLDELIEILEETPAYKDDFVKASTTQRGLPLVLSALQANFSNTLSRIRHFLPAKSKDDFNAFLMEYEVSDVKAILVSKALGQPLQKEGLYNVVVHPNLMKNLNEAATVDEAVSALARHKTYSAAAIVAREQLKAAQNASTPLDLRPVLDSLDTMARRSMLALATREHHYLSQIVHARLARQDAMLALRLLREKTPSAQIRGQLSLRPHSAGAERALQAPDFDAAVKAVGTHFQVAPEFITDSLETRSLVPLEIGLEQTYVKNVLRSSRLAVLTFATVIGFLFLKQVEVQNLRRIALGKHFHLEKELRQTIFAINA